jgi:hypothetical protein
MAEHNAVEALIDRIVRESHIADVRERADLRRELESHFAEVGATDDALHKAIDSFGSVSLLGAELRHAHARSPIIMRVLRLGCALIASSFVAVALELLANIRINAPGAGFGLGAGFSRSIVFSAMIIAVLVAAWELDIEAFCARLERHPVRMFSIVIGLATTIVAVHGVESSTLPPPGLALGASAIEVVIWTCTVAILASTDRIFARVFTVPPSRG